MDERCACGRPLHYISHAAKEVACGIVERMGKDVVISVGAARYLVQRHYIALHGLRAIDLPKLAEDGIVTRLDDW
jgi:hypothetical protein